MLQPGANHAVRLNEMYRNDVLNAVQGERLAREVPVQPVFIRRLAGAARRMLAAAGARLDYRPIAMQNVARHEA